jgi:hypothetical protein
MRKVVSRATKTKGTIMRRRKVSSRGFNLNPSKRKASNPKQGAK